MTAQYADEANHPLGPLRAPGQAGGLVDVFRRRYLLKLLVRKELHVRYQASALGLAWSYVKPAVRFSMYFFVIGLILNGSLENRALHIFAAMIVVQFFTDAMTSGTRSVVRNKALVRKINLPREMFPAASILVSAYHMIPMYLLMLTGCFITGWHPGVSSLAAFALSLAIVVVWGTGIALLFSAWNVLFRDMENVVDVVQTIITWLVPMIYPFVLIKDKLDGWTYQLYAANPLTEAVLLNQRAFWIPTTSSPAMEAVRQEPAHLFERGLAVLVVGLVFLGIAQLVFSRLEGRFAEQL